MPLHLNTMLRKVALASATVGLLGGLFAVPAAADPGDVSCSRTAQGKSCTDADSGVTLISPGGDGDTLACRHSDTLVVTGSQNHQIGLAFDEVYINSDDSRTPVSGSGTSGEVSGTTPGTVSLAVSYPSVADGQQLHLDVHVTIYTDDVPDGESLPSDQDFDIVGPC